MWELLQEGGARPPFTIPARPNPPKKDNFHSSPSVAKTPWREGQPRENTRKHPEPAMSSCRLAGLDWASCSDGNGMMHGYLGQWEMASLWGRGTDIYGAEDWAGCKDRAVFWGQMGQGSL